MRRAGKVLSLLLAVLVVAGWAQARKVERGSARGTRSPSGGVYAAHGRETATSGAKPARGRQPRVSGAQVVRQVPTERKVVALTFDDGPDPRYTPRVLRLLQARHAKATFFFIGENVARYPELARAVVAQGHAIGNHTWSHQVMAGHSRGWNLDEIGRCDQEIRAVCGVRPSLLRPPKGRWDEETRQAAEEMGYQLVLWTVALEHRSARTPQEMANRVLDRVKPGAIILCHDGRPGHPISREKTMKALPLVVQGLQRRGYRLVTVPELLELE